MQSDDDDDDNDLTLTQLHDIASIVCRFPRSPVDVDRPDVLLFCDDISWIFFWCAYRTLTDINSATILLSRRREKATSAENTAEA